MVRTSGTQCRFPAGKCFKLTLGGEKKSIHKRKAVVSIMGLLLVFLVFFFFFRESIRVRPALMHRLVSLRVSTADASAPAGRLLYVLILICACA